VNREGTITLPTVILAGIPQLNGVACVGHHQLYDEVPGRGQLDQRRERDEAAVIVCRGCPVRSDCPRRRFDATFPRTAAMKIPIAGSPLVRATIFQDHQ
jgi:hypothetical protein